MPLSLAAQDIFNGRLDPFGEKFNDHARAQRRNNSSLPCTHNGENKKYQGKYYSKNDAEDIKHYLHIAEFLAPRIRNRLQFRSCS